MRARSCGWVGIAAVVVPLACHAQAVAIGAGYAAPRPIDVAPGQVITLFVRIPGKTVSDPVTAQPPLPMMFAGFSVLLRQSFPSDPMSVPIQAVADSQSCSALVPTQCDVVSMVTVQIPFQLTPNIPRARLPQNFARLDINYSGNTATSLILNPVTDRIHVVNTCDVLVNSPQDTCVSQVAHPDGTVVSLEQPARVGETLTMSLVGLGQPDQTVATGAASPQPAVPVSDVLMSFDPRANASPGMPVPESALMAGAQLLPGAVGIYQVTFTVPALPNGTPACGDSIQSNLAVSVGRVTSYGGVAICVDPASGAQQ
jgi:uncharacterized protein (TIGR03437 family)